MTGLRGAGRSWRVLAGVACRQFAALDGMLTAAPANGLLRWSTSVAGCWSVQEAGFTVVDDAQSPGADLGIMR